MKDMPTILVCEEMIASIDAQIAELVKYKSPTPANFLYSYALFEGLLRELIFQIYRAFPKKLKGFCEDSTNPNDHFEIAKDEFLLTNNYYFVLNRIIDKKLYKISKDSISHLLKFFAKHSGIDIILNDSLLLDMTRARNIIAHNNGYNIKPWYIDSAMLVEILEEARLQQYLEYISDLCDVIKTKLNDKYKKYTYEKLLLDSWKYSCPMILSIYDIFDFSTGKASIKIDSAIKEISNLSSGEKYLVSIWLENYSLDVMYYIMSKVGTVYPPAHIFFSNEIRYLQQLFREYPYLVNGQPFLVENGIIKASN